MIDKDKIPAEVFVVLSKLQANGFRSFIVGGSVRDLLLGKKPKDFDICTEATSEIVKELFEKVIDTGVKFGTVTVLMGIPIEVTTFRKSVPFEDGQVVIGQSETDDVKARDFTVNALLFDGREVIDCVNGLGDLQEKIIRTVGNPDCRFREDALRMMRAIRLCCQLDFSIEQSTLHAVAGNAQLIKNVAQERIKEELVKILLSEVPSKGIRLMRKTGLLQYVLPELQLCYQFDQCTPYHDKDVFDHTMSVLDNTPDNLVVRLAALLHDVAKPKTFSVDDNGTGHFYSHAVEGYALSKHILSRLKFDKKTIDAVTILVKEHMSMLYVLRKASVKKMVNRVGPDKILWLIDLQIADKAGALLHGDFTYLQRLKTEVQKILDEKEPVSRKDLAINGNDLIEHGVSPGPQLGKILAQLLDEVICDPKINTKEDLLRLVSEWMG
ncbi:MAG: HD domain-containing protein [Clostridiales bacterium]|jgi:tRNA nucleotidyltransferase (CCA-adding enzyme)|nr:HD domain-containing protein [Clostridiales bacterium]